jgi:hypothetical protein
MATEKPRLERGCTWGAVSFDQVAHNFVVKVLDILPLGKAMLKAHQQINSFNDWK